MALKPVTVTQLNGYIKRVLQTDPVLGNVLVEGEVSNLKYHDSGHVYFSLKDENSVLRCFLSSSNKDKIGFRLEEGMKISAAGYVSVYERGGYYSLNVKDAEETGKGDLTLAFQQLKEKLLKEGLFDEEHKKPLPVFPKTVVLLTAATGAAVKDMIKIIRGRNSFVNIYIYPVPVQGSGAAEEIAFALDSVEDRVPKADVVIVGRGGGSTEDLWAFNEEVLARAIYRCKLPVISAVGHEVDYTISDFVADMRAPTPTAAAHMAVPDTDELLTDGEHLAESAETSLIRRINQKKERLNAYSWDYRRNSLANVVEGKKLKVAATGEKTEKNLERLLLQLKEMVNVKEAVLESAGPKKLLERGYTLTLDSDGKILSSQKNIEKEDILTVVFKDGKVRTKVTDKEANHEKTG